MSSDKSTVLKAFNTLFFDFVDDIIHIFPGNKDLVVARGSFETIKQANVTALIKAWYTYVYVPYSVVIDQGNLDFFFDKDYSGDLKESAHQSKVMEVIDTLRQPLKTMSEDNKEHSVNYLRNLCKLSVVYSSF
jgi:hypothetical protein